MTTRLQWRTAKTISCRDLTLPGAENLTIVVRPDAGRNQTAGIRPNSSRQMLVKRWVWPINWMHGQLFVTGFIERQLGRWMRRYIRPDSVFLEIGAGDMMMRRFLPRGVTYNALDIAFSEFALRRVLNSGGRVNPVIASATDIPLPDNSVDVIISKEVLPHIPEVGRAVSEMQRIARPGAKMMCSIGNAHSYKYQRKGLRDDFANPFTFDEFRSFIEARGFRCLESVQKGWWAPLPLWLTSITHQLPITSKNEYYNTNFMYLFEVQKEKG